MARKSKFDDLMEAITFAEAGEAEHASRIAAEVFPEAAARKGRILAVGGHAGFSRDMIEDGIGLAERLEFGIVALTVSPALSRVVARLGGRSRVRRLGRSAEAFRAKAEERGVPFIHAIRNGDPDRAVADIQRTFRRIAFLLIEPDLAPKARFASVNVPIFYLADGA
jgi:DNA-binding GntR family transcriptional regulator